MRFMQYCDRDKIADISRYFQMFFIQWKKKNFSQNSTEICFSGFIADINSPLVHGFK